MVYRGAKRVTQHDESSGREGQFNETETTFKQHPRGACLSSSASCITQPTTATRAASSKMVRSSPAHSRAGERRVGRQGTSNRLRCRLTLHPIIFSMGFTIPNHHLVWFHYNQSGLVDHFSQFWPYIRNSSERIAKYCSACQWLAANQATANPLPLHNQLDKFALCPLDFSHLDVTQEPGRDVGNELNKVHMRNLII